MPCQTGGLFRLAVGLMQALDEETGAVSGWSTKHAAEDEEGDGSVPASTFSSSKELNFGPLVDKLALYFQIRDDLVLVMIKSGNI